MVARTKEEKEKIAKMRMAEALMELEATAIFIQDTDLELVSRALKDTIYEASNIYNLMVVLVPNAK